MLTTKRTCGDCSECCRSGILGSVHGKMTYKGIPCHFLSGNKCSIYSSRPDTPCKQFNCVWLDDTKAALPEWMRPDLSGVMIVESRWGEDKTFWVVSENKGKIDATVLNWLVMHFLQTGTCMAVQVDGGWNHYGSVEFLQSRRVSSSPTTEAQ